MNIVESQGTYRFFNDVKIIDRLEVGNYILRYNDFGIWLEKAHDFELPKRLYDIEKDFRKMMLKSYKANKSNMGVLLKGYKGQGKTVTAKQLCIESGLPVVLIDSSVPLHIDYISFLNDIRQEFVLFVDEFEKIFSRTYDSDGKYHSQESLLTLTDGALTNGYNKIFLFTTNDDVNDKFINRPSRIRFYKKYEYMNAELYTMVIDDLLENKAYEEDLRENLTVGDCTTDLLISIIKEVNNIDAPYSSFKDVFNHESIVNEYDLSIYDESTKTFIDLDTINLSGTINRDTSYVSNMCIDSVISNSKSGMIFKSDEQYNYGRGEFEKIYKNIKGPYVYKIKEVINVKDYAF